MDKKKCGVGLVGAGVVGGGVAEMLLTRGNLLAERAGVRLDLVAAADKFPDRAVAVGIPRDILVDDYRRVIENPGVEVVVELVGGVGIAYDVVMAALEAGKHVVTANKALLAEKGGPIFRKAKEKNAVVAFEAAVAGGIPIIQAIRDGLVVSRLQSLLGIVNGTCNYILSEMNTKNIAFADCLAEAQRLGFAEADPTTDIDGFDSGHKLALLSALAFGAWIDYPSIHIEGIRDIQDADVKFTKSLGYTIKLLAVARPDPRPERADAGGKGEIPAGARLFLSVHPALLRNNHPLATVMGSLNAVELEGDVVMESMFYGRGAGRYPTASAVVADIAAVAKQVAFGGIGPRWLPPAENAYALAPMHDYQARYYLRFVVQDKPGVMGKLTTILGARNVSIAAMHQFEDDLADGLASVCLLTHDAREGDVAAALTEIAGSNLVKGKPALLRIEG